jgi:FlgD Ig-like domain
MRTMDERGNWSAVSNIVRFDWPPDAAPPAAPAGVAGGVLPGGTSVRVSWSPNPEADLAGYRVYRAAAAPGPWTRVASVGVGAAEWTDTQLPVGADEVWYAVSAFDRSGGEGARSATISVPLQTPLAGAPLAWGLEAAYPNPARAGEVTHIPVTIPAGGGVARVDLLDSAGRQVRRFDIGSASPGIVDLWWDGHNDAGRACAPGVYRAVLVAPGTTRFLLVARVP